MDSRTENLKAELKRLHVETAERVVCSRLDSLVRPPSSYEEYLLLSEKDKLRLMRQSKNTKRPNAGVRVDE